MERTTDTVEAIQASLEQLVSQRQTLRASAAEATLLERNRLEIARLQQLLSEALIKKHSRVAA